MWRLVSLERLQTRHSGAWGKLLSVRSRNGNVAAGTREGEGGVFHAGDEAWSGAGGGLDGHEGSWSQRLRGEVGTLDVSCGAVFGSCHKECAGSGDQIQAIEVHVAAIHHTKDTEFENQFVEPENIVLKGPSDRNARRNRTSQGDLRIDFDSRLGCSEVGPREKRQGEIDRGRVQSINGVLDVETNVFPGIKRASFPNEAFG